MWAATPKGVTGVNGDRSFGSRGLIGFGAFRGGGFTVAAGHVGKIPKMPKFYLYTETWAS